jgi:hypothetical protein
MLRFLSAALVALTLAACSTQAPAQSALLQAGPAAAGRAPMYVNSGNGQAVVTDSGPASGGAVGIGMGEGLYVARGTGTPPYAGQGTGPLGTNWCDYDAPTTNATGYHYLCLSPNAQGGGLLAYGAGGVASALPFTFNINGVEGLPYTILQNIPAATILMNPTAATGAVQAATIQGLTASGTVSPTLDFFLVYNHTTGTFQKATANDIAIAVGSGVTSIGGASGVILLSDGIFITGQSLYTASPISTVSATAAVSGQQKEVLCDATAGSVVLTLPTAASVLNGKGVVFKRKDASANTCTIVVSGGGNIDTFTTLSLASRGETYTTVSDGSTQWWLE